MTLWSSRNRSTEGTLCPNRDQKRQPERTVTFPQLVPRAFAQIRTPETRTIDLLSSKGSPLVRSPTAFVLGGAVSLDRSGQLHSRHLSPPNEVMAPVPSPTGSR